MAEQLGDDDHYVTRMTSKVNASFSVSEDVQEQVTNVTISLKWTKRDQIALRRPPLHGCFGDDWMTMADNLLVPEEDGYWQIDPESITMALLRAAWITAHIEATERDSDEVPKEAG